MIWYFLFYENKPNEKIYPEKNKNTRHETNKAIKATMKLSVK
jgi:hypothetical protein